MSNIASLGVVYYHSVMKPQQRAMLSRLPILLLALLALAVVSCSEEAPPAATEAPESADVDVSPAPDSEAYPAGDGYPAPAAGDEGEDGYPPPYGQVLVESADSPTVDPSSVITRELENPIAPDEPVPTPEAGRAMVTGHVRSSVTNQMMQATPVRLAEVYYNEEGDAAFVLSGAQSPGTLTDVEGRFIFQNVEPRDYVLVVGNVESGLYEIIAASPTEAQVWTAPADEILDVGELVVELE